MTVRKLQQPRGWAIGLGVVILKPTLLAATSRTWIDGEKIPATGGCLVVLNHISHLDPLFAAHFLYDHGRLPRYLAKSGLFTNKALGTFLRSAGQIPVERLSRSAASAYDAAVAAVRSGECVVVYPEGTLTRDPELWPMTGKTGAARIALETGCPGDPRRPVGRARGAAALRPAPRPAAPQERHDEGGRPGLARRPALTQPRTPELLAEAHRADHGRDHGDRRGAARRGAACRALRRHARRVCGRPATRTSTAREEESGGDRPMSGKVAVLSAGSWGTAFSIVLADAGNDVVLWARREELAKSINERRENPDYLPGIELPSRVSATHDVEQALAGADVVVLATPSQTLRAQPHRVGAVRRARRRAGLADEGRRARHPRADERGDRRGDRRRPGADRGGQRPQPLARDRPPRAGRLRGRVRRRGRRADAAEALPLTGVPALHQHRRARLRARRRLQERHRPRGRHGGRARLRRQHHGVGDHPRPRRDHPAGHRARRQPADPDGPRRPRRPRRHLLVAAVAQPHASASGSGGA